MLIETIWQPVIPWPTRTVRTQKEYTVMALKDEVINHKRFKRVSWTTTEWPNRVCRKFDEFAKAKELYKNLKENNLSALRDWVE